MLSAANRDRVAAYLNYPVTLYYTGAIYDACETLERHGGTVAENRVVGYLDSLDAIDAALTSGADGAGLIKADVLEWAQGGRTTGYYRERGRIIGLLASTLDLKPYGVSGSGNTLLRG